MNLLNNFFKKLNNPVPAFVQTKLEKDGSNEPTLNSKPKTTFRRTFWSSWFYEITRKVSKNGCKNS